MYRLNEISLEEAYRLYEAGFYLEINKNISYKEPVIILRIREEE